MLKFICAIAVLLVVILVAASKTFRGSTRRDSVASPGQPGTSHVVSASDAAIRSLCLASILARTNLEYEAKSQETHAPNGDVDRIFQKNQRQGMENMGLWSALSSRERALMKKPVGSWSTQDIADGQWRAEALRALLWALKSFPSFPPYDEQAPIGAVTAVLPPPDKCQRFISNAALRDDNDIARARSIAELWLWRARTTQLQMSGATPPEGWTFEKIISVTAEWARKEQFFSPIDQDFPALNKPYSKLSEDEWRTVHSIAQERLYALNWLCKYADDWDAVPTGT